MIDRDLLRRASFYSAMVTVGEVEEEVSGVHGDGGLVPYAGEVGHGGGTLSKVH